MLVNRLNYGLFCPLDTSNIHGMNEEDEEPFGAYVGGGRGAPRVIVGTHGRYRADCHAKTRAQNVIGDLFQILLNA